MHGECVYFMEIGEGIEICRKHGKSFQIQPGVQGKGQKVPVNIWVMSVY